MSTRQNRERMREVITTYFQGCNESNVAKIMACCAADAVHYFPAGAPQGPFIGAASIAQGWKDSVARVGSHWSIDRMAFDEVAGEAIIEWTHYKTKLGTYLRGDEWYRFNDEGLITEIRAYYACPPTNPSVTHQLGGFDYLVRGYSTAPS